MARTVFYEGADGTDDMPLALMLALLIGASLVLLGAGGSIVTMPVLVYGVGLDAHEAAGTSLLVVGAVAVAGAIAKRSAVRLRTGLLVGGAGMAGALPGAWLNHQVAAEWVLAGFGVTMLIAARQMRASCGRGRCEERGAVAAMSLGAIVGLATGFFGVGGGFLIVPALTMFLGLDMQRGVATSLLVIALNSAAGLLMHGALASVRWDLGLAFAAAALLGAVAVIPLSRRLSARALRTAFAALLAVVGTGMLAHTLHGVLG